MRLLYQFQAVCVKDIMNYLEKSFRPCDERLCRLEIPPYLFGEPLDRSSPKRFFEEGGPRHCNQLIRVFESDQARVAINCAFFNRIVDSCPIISEFHLSFATLCRQGSLDFIPLLARPDASDLTNVVSQNLFRQFGAYVFILPPEDVAELIAVF